MLEDKFDKAPKSFMGHTTRSGDWIKQAICTEADLDVSDPRIGRQPTNASSVKTLENSDVKLIGKRVL